MLPPPPAEPHDPSTTPPPLAAARPPEPPRPPPSPLDRRSGRHAARLAEARKLRDARRPTSKPLDHAGQQPRRDREHDVRKEALGFARWARRHGASGRQAAQRLGLRPATLNRWDRQWLDDRLAGRPLGRPRRRADLLQCLEVVQHLRQVGPTVGLPALRGQFPQLARSQLAELQQDYRDQWFCDHAMFTNTLEWLVPGAVWATDFSHTPVPLDGGLHDVLAVRDLAARMQLSLLPIKHADALTAAANMEHLFFTFGPPLILKSDNGSPFVAGLFEELLLRWDVIPLLSPPHCPQYNGSIEAGFGSAKTRIYIEAARHGRIDHWAFEDVEAARQLANCASRPWGAARPTPQEAWDRRTPITPQQRQAFRQSVLDHQRTVRLELGYRPDQQLDPKARATVAREAIRRALEGLGYLQIRRRRITPPFKTSLCAIIS
jgi:transposase InsO family protein